MCRRLAGRLLRSRHASQGHSQRPLVRQVLPHVVIFARYSAISECPFVEAYASGVR